MGWQCVVLRSSLMSSRAAFSCAGSDAAAAMHLTARALCGSRGGAARSPTRARAGEAEEGGK
uniref:Uncharacterized protein n=1 Tax=Arundo donax TaxID=35708 RepID=A0A0A9ET39_ARUDO